MALSVAFAIWMRERADKLGLSQQQVGESLGLTKQSMTGYYRYATGKGGTRLTLDQIERLAETFETTVEAALQDVLAIQAKGELYREVVTANPRQTRLRSRLVQRHRE